MDYSPPGSSVQGDSSGKNTGVGCHALLQGNSYHRKVFFWLMPDLHHNAFNTLILNLPPLTQGGAALMVQKEKEEFLQAQGNLP